MDKDETSISSSYLEELEDWPDDYSMDYDEEPPTQKELDYAKSLVGKFCLSKSDCTPFLSNLLCKVTRVNNDSRGGNPTQVWVKVYRCKQMWAFKTWYLIGTNGEKSQVVDSGWLISTDRRPTFLDRINYAISTPARIVTCWISQEHKAFQYEWWYRDSIWQYLPPIAGLLSSFVDFIDSFRYGIYLQHRKFKT